MRYIDTCVLMMFADPKDPLRKGYGLGRGKAENMVVRNHGGLSIPMPACGEALCKMRDKCGDRLESVIREFNRLLDAGFLSVSYIRDAGDTFYIAKRLSERTDDSRDWISPMDALIAAAACTDPDCTMLYTSDSSLIADARTSEIIDEYREDNGYGDIRVCDISDLIRV
jgi:hypothetical protein